MTTGDRYDRRIKHRFDEYHDGIGYSPDTEKSDDFADLITNVIIAGLAIAVMVAVGLCWFGAFFGWKE